MKFMLNAIYRIKGISDYTKNFYETVEVISVNKSNIRIKNMDTGYEEPLNLHDSDLFDFEIRLDLLATIKNRLNLKEKHRICREI